jgi:hypothetical protein
MNTSQATSLSVTLGRITWMVLGPFATLLCAFSVAEHGRGWFTVRDALLFLFLAATFLGRYMESLGGEPRTSTGEPAAPGALRRYGLGLAAAGVALWAVANLLGNHVFPR